MLYPQQSLLSGCIITGALLVVCLVQLVVFLSLRREAFSFHHNLLCRHGGPGGGQGVTAPSMFVTFRSYSEWIVYYLC